MNKPVVHPAALQIELQGALGDISDLEPLIEGEESRVFGFRWEGADFVVRVNPSADGFHKDAFAYRRFATPTLPIPEVLSIGRLGSGHAYCVSRRLPGPTLQELAGPDLQLVLEPVAQVMAAIAASDITGMSGFGPFDASGVGQCASWRDFLNSVGDRRHYDWNAAGKHIDIDRVKRILDLIDDLADACPEVRQLVHGDFGSNNVLTGENRITGVIDWSEALFGDPLYDVANILFWRPWLDCMEQQARYFEQQQPELLRDAERLRCYQLRIGVAEVYESAISGNDRLVAWAMSRCEAIAAGDAS